jgi:two-component system, OmpR family, phosphate regulon response regulator PhoB
MNMKNEKVLLVEDASDMQLMVQSTLGASCEVLCAKSLKEAEELLTKERFDLMVLDVVLPDGNGFEFCKTIKARSELENLAIIFLTGENQVNDRVLGFDLGADDYVVKPFEPNEFRARVLSKLKGRALFQEQTSFSSGIFYVDWPLQKASLRKDQFKQDLGLTPIEFKLLVQFLRNEGKIFSREELLTAVWGQSTHVTEHTVDTHISSLRKKVGEYGKYFKAVVRKGYTYSCKVKGNPPNTAA